jgi:cytochrome b subunit of formate dehydrogenase
VSTLAALVVLLVILVVGLITGAVIYTVYRRPALSSPVMAGLATVAAFAAVLAVIVAAGGGT